MTDPDAAARLAQIRQRHQAGVTMYHVDVAWLLAQVDRLTQDVAEAQRGLETANRAHDLAATVIHQLQDQRDSLQLELARLQTDLMRGRALTCVNCGLTPADAVTMRAWKDAEAWQAYPRAPIDRQHASAWFIANGFVVETFFGDAGRYGKSWSTREGMGHCSLEFIPHDYGWSAIVGAHASGENPRMEIGTCATVQDIARTTEAIRLINGHKQPEPSALTERTS